MKPFVAIIGGSNSGKSTVICSLTGCGTHGFRDVVTDRQRNQSIYVIASSPQELNLGLSELNRILNQVLDDDTILGAIISIQPTHPRSRLSMEDILNAVELAGGFNSFAIMLDPPYNDHPTHHNVADVRARLQAIGIELNVLDGRRFAHLNACAVCALTGLPPAGAV